jgi:hypothetical protein
LSRKYQEMHKPGRGHRSGWCRTTELLVGLQLPNVRLNALNYLHFGGKIVAKHQRVSSWPVPHPPPLVIASALQQLPSRDEPLLGAQLSG